MIVTMQITEYKIHARDYILVLYHTFISPVMLLVVDNNTATDTVNSVFRNDDDLCVYLPSESTLITGGCCKTVEQWNMRSSYIYDETTPPWYLSKLPGIPFV